MSRTIGQLVIGTKVLVQEGETWHDYYIMESDDQGVVLLRLQGTAGSAARSTSNAASYPDSLVDTTLNDSSSGFLSTLSAGAQGCLTPRNIQCQVFGDTTLTTIQRKIWLPSYYNIMGETDGTYLAEGNDWTAALYLMTGAWGADARKCVRDNGNSPSYYWWLRSISGQWGGYLITSAGAIGSDGPKNGYTIRPVINVASASIVADLGDGSFSLSPNGETPTFIVSFDEKIAETQGRPTKARIEYNQSGLNNVVVQVCNNYGDAEPVWVTATSGSEVELTNETKTTTNWQIGIKMYGESTTSGGGYFTEPKIYSLEVVG